MKRMVATKEGMMKMGVEDDEVSDGQGAVMKGVMKIVKVRWEMIAKAKDDEDKSWSRR